MIDDLVVTLDRAGGEYRAGGTDVTARWRAGRATGPFVDLRPAGALHGIDRRPDGSATIGAMTSVAELAADPRLRADYPALAATAGALATPQIRAAGTLGGNLLQRNRCWYYRNSRFSCFQTGGDGCPARSGQHLYSAVIDTGPCVAPHPSSLAMALLAYDAHVQVHGRDPLPIADLYGDGSGLGDHDHLLAPADVLVAATLPAPTPGERAAYHRAIGRFEAEWPLVEAVARLTVESAGAAEPVVTAAAVAVGGVARVPLRLPEVEAALVGRPATPATLHAAAATATQRCRPLPQTGYKVGLLRDTVLEVIERALAPAARSTAPPTAPLP